MKTIRHKFVQYIPEELEDGVIYISIEFCTAIHKCVCGCGNEVVTPISPTDWTLKFNGKTISLSPSIGNWNFECKSHYWIKRNKIIHSPVLSDEEIELIRSQDYKEKSRYFKKSKKRI